MNNKNFLWMPLLFASIGISAQFNVTAKVSGGSVGNEAYLYSLDGSKDILVSKLSLTGDSFKYKVPNRYVGMMKLFFPKTNYAVNFISENKDVNLDVKVSGDKVSEIVYNDASNRLMNDVQDKERKKQYILPALYQIMEYYKPSDVFYAAMEKEVKGLSDAKTTINSEQNPFVSYYVTNYGKYVEESANSAVSDQDLIKFISNSNELLETSSLLRPVLLRYLNTKGAENNDAKVDKLLTAVNVETSRGQTVLSEFIDIFDVYSMNTLKEKYLNQAKNLKCEINSRLTSTIQTNESVNVGAVFANSNLDNAINTTAKSLHDLKAAKKVIVFWSSTCSHCETDLPNFIPVYQKLKAANIEIVGFSLDSEQSAYQNKAKNYPWISSSELKGWYSSYVDKYNVHATPSYFVLDANNKIIAKPNMSKDVLEFLGVK